MCYGDGRVQWYVAQLVTTGKSLEIWTLNKMKNKKKNMRVFC